MGNCESHDILCPFYHSYYIDFRNKLPSMGADPDLVTFSGFSSGSWMSHQLHIVYSDTIKAVALHNGGPYGHNFNDLEGTLEAWKDLVVEASDAGTIADITNIKNSPVMIVTGSNDDKALPEF